MHTNIYRYNINEYLLKYFKASLCCRYITVNFIRVDLRLFCTCSYINTAISLIGNCMVLPSAHKRCNDSGNSIAGIAR